MFLLSRHSDEYRGKHCEYICLNERNQKFKAVHKHSEQHCDDCHRAIDDRSQLHCHKDNGNKSQNHRMILANSLTISENGLAISPKISIICIIGSGNFKNIGTSGQRISFQ